MAVVRVARLEEGLKRIKARADVNLEKANREKMQAAKRFAVLLELSLHKSNHVGLSALRNFAKEERRG